MAIFARIEYIRLVYELLHGMLFCTHLPLNEG